MRAKGNKIRKQQLHKHQGVCKVVVKKMALKNFHLGVPTKPDKHMTSKKPSREASRKET